MTVRALFLSEKELFYSRSKVILSHAEKDRNNKHRDRKDQKIIFTRLEREILLIHQETHHIKRHQVHQVGVE